MDHDLVLEGRVVTPQGLQDTEVGVTDGLIAKIGRGLRGDRRIRADRSLIFPGFVDIHVHLREPGWEHKEGFRTGSLAAAHGGVTTVADMPNNPIPTTTRAAVELKKRLSSEKSKVGVVFYGGVVPKDLGLLNEIADQVVGFKLYLSETTGVKAFPSAELAKTFEAIARTGRPVSVHCEDQAAIDRARERLRGEDRPDVYGDLRPPEAEANAVKEVLEALQKSGGVRANVCHSSLGETVSMASRARAAGSWVYCEAALHHLYFNRRALLTDRMLKTNPPLRSEDEREALLQGLKAGKVSFLVTDHAPHLEEEKLSGGAAGIPGLDDYGHLVSWLIRGNGVEPSTIAAVASRNPARFLGLDDRGTISEGKKADFAVLDLHSPEKVRNEHVRSKCGWSPYQGKEFPGRVRWTVVGGELLMDDFEMVT